MVVTPLEASGRRAGRGGGVDPGCAARADRRRGAGAGRHRSVLAAARCDILVSHGVRWDRGSDRRTRPPTAGQGGKIVQIEPSIEIAQCGAAADPQPICAGFEARACPRFGRAVVPAAADILAQRRDRCLLEFALDVTRTVGRENVVGATYRDV
jgi:hypothetical protein